MGPGIAVLIGGFIGIIHGDRDMGHFGGCAVTESYGVYMLECTYGALAECPPDNLDCDITSYAVQIEASPEDFATQTYNLLDHYRDVGFENMPVIAVSSPDGLNNYVFANKTRWP